MLFEYPKETKFNRILPKSKIYEKGDVNSKVKALFTSQVEQIIWKNKLSAQTLNVESNDTVSEIQIFLIKLKGTELSHEVLSAIDKAIPLPIIFELQNFAIGVEPRVKMVASYKQIKKGGKIELSNYFASEWSADNSKKQILPITLNMKSLYDEMIRELLPITSMPDENVLEQIERVKQIDMIKKNLKKLKTRLNSEKQFKKKVLLNNQFKAINAELASLT